MNVKYLGLMPVRFSFYTLFDYSFCYLKRYWIPKTFLVLDSVDVFIQHFMHIFINKFSCRIDKKLCNDLTFDNISNYFILELSKISKLEVMQHNLCHFFIHINQGWPTLDHYGHLFLNHTWLSTNIVSVK